MRFIPPILFALSMLALSGCALFDRGPSGDSDNAVLPTMDIPYSRFVLSNGLTLIVHEDQKAPLVSVNVWYHVGSKNEQAGKTGFAHLFEHLMFNGSEHYDDDYFRPFEEAGATGMNGTTNVDRTNYYETVPTPALDMALWMESDRMGHFLGAVSQEKLDEQIGVVLNEKGRGENQPYGLVWPTISANTYPQGHPYSWPTIGYQEDIESFELDAVKAWFEKYYGAANSVLVISGDVETEAVYEKVRHYFGNIPAGPPLIKPAENIAEMSGPRRVVMSDNVPQARVYLVWNVPADGSADADYLNLFSDVLATGKNSRLYKRLVYRDQVATSVSSYVWEKELGSQFVIAATVKPGGDTAKVEAMLREELEAALSSRIQSSELSRIRNGLYAGMAHSFQRVGGKGALLASSEIMHGDAGAWKESLNRLLTAHPKQITQAAQRWLHDGHLTLEVQPFPTRTVSGVEADRSALPSAGAVPELRLPAFERATLSNGLEVILAQRHDAPSVSMSLQFNAGYAADKISTPGLASLTMSMLDEGTIQRDSLTIAAELDELGSGVSAGARLDTLSVGMSSLTPNLSSTLDIFADVLLNPAFPESELERLRDQFLAQIQREQSQPQSMALRVLPPLVFGSEHAYGQALTGSGTAEGIAQISQADLKAFHQRWIRPDNATLMVVGDVTLETLLPLLEAELAGWKAPAEALPDLPRFDVPHKAKAEVYMIDRPNSPQTMIVAGHVAPSNGDERNIPLGLVNRVFGGMFTSRLNMNLREDKGWSYGASSTVISTQHQRLFLAYSSVQADKTAESMREMLGELRGVDGRQRITATELQRAQDNVVRKLPGHNETQGEVLGTMSTLTRLGLADDYYDSYVGRVTSVSVDQANQVARDVLEPNRLVWVVVGDRSQIEADVRKLKLGKIHFIDVDGNPAE